ncbi:hypothetical protein CEXT_754651 [Caerostris extrusa]|nr:hypothetical protein CEXT_754651 [Caerostris extrusa]
MVKKRKRTCENALVNQNSKRAALQPFSKILEFNRQRENREKIVEANFNTYIDHLKEIDSKGILPEVSTLHNYIFNDDSVVRNEENN